MKIDLVQVPYDSGHKRARMGRGPEHLIEGGIPDRLRSCGHEVRMVSIEATNPFSTESAIAFELSRLLATHVSAACNAGRLPIVFAGNCLSCLGTLAGVGPAQTGVIWFDSHGDFNTPETTRSGFLDGMALAVATGRCWTTMAQTIPGFEPVGESSVVIIGARDLDAEEKELIEHSRITTIGADLIRQRGAREALGHPLSDLRDRVERVYVHVDLDVLDPAEGRANAYAAPDGLSLDDLVDAIGMITERFTICASAITAYDPAYDHDGRVLRAGMKVIESLIKRVSA